MSFDELDALLSSDMNDNYWQDEALDLAAEQLDAFGSSDWERLITALVGRPVSWRIRTAEALGSTDAAEAIPILCTLLADEQLDVATAALEALECRDDIFHPTAALRIPIVTLRDRLEPTDRPTADALLKRIPK